MGYSTLKNNTLYLSCTITPGAQKNEVVGILGDSLKIRIKAQAKEGEANAELLSFLSKWLKIPKAHLSLLKGHTSRVKIIKIEPCYEMPKPFSDLECL